MLEDELDRRGISHGYYSLSDELRAEVRVHGLAVDRDNLRATGHDLRLKYGSDVLSQRVLDRIAEDQGQGLDGDVVVIDAIRNPAEALRLREGLGQNFTLVAIVAEEEMIIQRIRSRGRQGDIVHTDALARQLLAAEMGTDEPEHGHNIAECIAQADVRIDNSESLERLHETVRGFVDNYAPSLT